MSEFNENLSDSGRITERRSVDRRSLTTEQQIEATKFWLASQRDKPGRTDEEFLRIVARSMVARDLLRTRADKRTEQSNKKANEANENARLANQSKREDPLTRLLNRGAFNEDCLEMAKGNEPFGLLIVDLDHFKNVNDGYGHPAGDMVLYTTALNLTSALRETRDSQETDKIFRYGGEEFVIAVSGVSEAEDLKKIAERIRMNIYETPYTVIHEGKPVNLSLTVSIGGGIFQPGMEIYPDGYQHTSNQTNNPLGYFFDKVDDGLYQAKKNGRNQTVIVS